MNICVIVDNEFNNDPRVRREVDVLVRAGHSIYVLCYGFDNKIYDDIENVTIVRIRISSKKRNLLFFLFNLISLYEKLWSKHIGILINQCNPDVLHVHDLYMSRAAFIGNKRAGKDIPITLDLHENYPYAIESYNWTKGLLRRTITQTWKWKSKEGEYLGYASKIIVLSSHYKTELLNKYDFLNKEKIFVYPNFPDIRRFQKFQIKSVDFINIYPPILLYFGGISERRGIFATLDILREVLEIGKSASLLCVGPVDKSDSRRFKKYLKDKVLENHVQHIPWIDISVLPSVMEASDIGVASFIKNPQHDSGVANKIYQYMFGKLPILASNCLPQKEVIVKYECGLVYENKQQFLEYLILLIESAELRKKLGENGYNAIKNKIDFNKYNQNLLKAIGSK